MGAGAARRGVLLALHVTVLPGGAGPQPPLTERVITWRDEARPLLRHWSEDRGLLSPPERFQGLTQVTVRRRHQRIAGRGPGGQKRACLLRLAVRQPGLPELVLQPRGDLRSRPTGGPKVRERLLEPFDREGVGGPHQIAVRAQERGQRPRLGAGEGVPALAQGPGGSEQARRLALGRARISLACGEGRDEEPLRRRCRGSENRAGRPGGGSVPVTRQVPARCQICVSITLFVCVGRILLLAAGIGRDIQRSEQLREARIGA